LHHHGELKMSRFVPDYPVHAVFEKFLKLLKIL